MSTAFQSTSAQVPLHVGESDHRQISGGRYGNVQTTRSLTNDEAHTAIPKSHTLSTFSLGSNKQFFMLTSLCDTPRRCRCCSASSKCSEYVEQRSKSTKPWQRVKSSHKLLRMYSNAITSSEPSTKKLCNRNRCLHCWFEADRVSKNISSLTASSDSTGCRFNAKSLLRFVMELPCRNYVRAT